MIKIRIIAFTALCFPWHHVASQQRNLKAASRFSECSVCLENWREGPYFMRNGAGLDYFIICFVLSYFMKAQVTFSPTKVFVMCCNHGAV